LSLSSVPLLLLPPPQPLLCSPLYTLHTQELGGKIPELLPYEQDAHAVRLLMPRSRPTTAPRPRPDFLYPCSPPLPHLSAPPLLVLSPLVPTPPAPLSIP